MKRRRVKITGIGPVTPAGIGREAFWKGILEPVSRVGRLRRTPDEIGALVAAEVKDFRVEDYVPEMTKRAPRHTQFAVAATVLALRDAGILPSDLRDESPVIAIGTVLVDFAPLNKALEAAAAKGSVTPMPSIVSSILTSSINTAVSNLIEGTTRSMSLQSACCSGLDAIGYGANFIASGEADFAICGGSEAPLHIHPLIELKMSGLIPAGPNLAERQGRPFDLWRMGGAMGEGACMLLLEPESSPRPGYAYIEGYGFAADANGNLAEGITHSARLALANSRRKCAEVDCINAWGTGHRQIDVAEAAALSRVFGSHLPSIPVVSLKGAIGNPFAAAGAIQTGAAALGLQSGMIPPTVNWEFPDPGCPLSLSGKPRLIPHELTLIDSHGLSGNNGCLVLAR